MADQLSGFPTAGGAYKPVFIVTDSLGNASSPTELDVTINAGAAGLQFVTTALNVGTSGVAYSQQLAVQGGVTPYTFTEQTGLLTGSGVSLSSGGLLSGSSPVAGTYGPLQFVVTDFRSSQAFSLLMNLTISATAQTLQVTTLRLGNATVGVPYSMQLNAQGGTLPYTWSLSSGSLTGSGISLSSSGLLSGSNPGSGAFTGLVFEVADSASHTAFSGTLSLDVIIPAPSFYPLPIVAEILIGGAWIDISQYVYQRDGIQISGGRTSRTDQNTRAKMTLTLNNRDGRFSENFVNGPYWPNLTRNTQIRLSIDNATSSSGNVYSGYRFWGKVDSWPAQSDVSGQDVYEQISCSGPLREISRGGGEGSALTRYYATLTGLEAPIAYWPCEEDPDATQIQSGLTQPPVGADIPDSANMIVASGKPTWKAVSDFNGSAPIAVVNQSVWTGITNSFGTSGDELFLDPGTWQWIASTTSVQVKCVGGGGGGTNGNTGPGNGGTGGGGGQWCGNTVKVTPGQVYNVVVGAGGSPGRWAFGASTGDPSSFAGDQVTVTAHAGGGGGINGNHGGTGGSGGSPGTGGTTFAGGAGGTSPGGLNGGGGGGGSGGSGAAGRVGGNAITGNWGSGGAKVAGGGSGGHGGYGGDPQPGQQPGGGGGGGWANFQDYSYGAPGAPGSVELIYKSSQAGNAPNDNVIRFIVFVPKHGGNDGAVLVRALGTGTVAKLDCQYRAGKYGGVSGKLRMLGYDGSNTQLFDSGNLELNAGLDGRTMMVSMELSNQTGAAGVPIIGWQLEAIFPGDAGVGSQVVAGTLTSASMGSVSQVEVDPLATVTKTAIGHISVQYAYVPLWKVSQALNGHYIEATTDRFSRLAYEEGMDTILDWSEQLDHWGWEDGTLQNWTATNATLTNSTFTYMHDHQDRWPIDGSAHCLLMTCNGSGQPVASSQPGLSGLPVQPGDVASLSVDIFSLTQLNNAYIGIQWYDINGTAIGAPDAQSLAADRVILAGEPTVIRLGGSDAQAPAVVNGDAGDAQFMDIIIGDHETPASGTKIYVDNVRLSPHMGAQERHSVQRFIEELHDMEQGILKEAVTLWGLKMRTRINITAQTAAISIPYSAQFLAQPLAPVLDDRHVRNDVTVHRHKGSSFEVTLNNGVMSILEPPLGAGRYKRRIKAVANADEQLAALAYHILDVGTAADERYPTISINLGLAGFPGNPAAPLMSAIAGVEEGDMVEITGLPFWYPSSTAQQMVIGYTETLNTFSWIITWNCIQYSPYITVTSRLHRW